MSLYLTILLTLLIISSLGSTTTNFLHLPQQTMAQIEDDGNEEDSLTTTITTGELTTYENSTYGIKIQYPSDWSIDETDPDPEDRLTPVVTFFSPFETPEDTYSEYIIVGIDNIPYKADLAEYLQESIDTYKGNEDFEIVESNTDAKLAGNPAYSLTVTYTSEPENEDDPTYDLETMEIATIIENKGYYIAYTGEEDAFSGYLPTIQKMIDSLVIDASASPTQQGRVSQSNASLQDDQSEDFLQYDNTDLGINIQFPSNWEQSESTTSNGDPSIGFVSPFESNTDKFPEMLWIAVESLDYTNVNIADEGNEVINTLKNDFPNFQLIESDTNSLLAGNPAYKFVFTYTEGVEFGNCRGVCDQKGMFMGTIIDNKEYRIEYYGEAAAYDTYLPIIERMIDSFKISPIDDGISSEFGTPLQEQDNQTDDVQSVGGFLQYQNSSLGITLQYPSNWQQEPGDSDSIVRYFISPQESDNDAFADLFYISVYNSENTPLDENVAAMLNSLSRAFSDFTPIESNPITLAGNPAHRLVYGYTDPEIGALQEMQVLTVKDDILYTFTYLAEQSKYVKYLPIVLDIFKSIEIGSPPKSNDGGSGGVQENAPPAELQPF